MRCQHNIHKKHGTWPRERKKQPIGLRALVFIFTARDLDNFAIVVHVKLTLVQITRNCEREGEEDAVKLCSVRKR